MMRAVFASKDEKEEALAAQQRLKERQEEARRRLLVLQYEAEVQGQQPFRREKHG